MSAVTKKKYVIKELLEDEIMPECNQTIVQILKNAGCNLFAVLNPDGLTFLASLPRKFRKTIWIKRGDFVVTEQIDEGVKVKAEIVKILYPQHIKAIKQSNLWPSCFENAKKEEYAISDNTVNKSLNLSISENYNEKRSPTDAFNEIYESDDDFADIPMNTNRPVEELPESDDDASEDET